MDMQVLLTATSIYLDAPFAAASGDALSRDEEKAVITARTLLAMASDSLGDPPIVAREADVSFTPDEARVLARAVGACLEAGVSLDGLGAAYAKVVSAAG